MSRSRGQETRDVRVVSSTHSVDILSIQRSKLRLLKVLRERIPSEKGGSVLVIVEHGPK